MMVRRPPAPSALELAWLGLMLASLAVALAFEHWFVHRGMLLPVSGGGVPPWIYGALFVPELVTCFLAGWRLRSKAWIVAYAISAAVVRQGFEALLAAMGEPGHTGAFQAAEFAFATPVIVFVYALVFGLAAESSREIDPAKGL